MQFLKKPIDFENVICCPPMHALKSMTGLFPLHQKHWNLLGFASIALLQTQRTVIWVSDL